MEYLIQLNYKSGRQINFWCKAFEVKPNGSISWTAADEEYQPLSIANEITDIESIWQIDSREVPDEVPLPVIEE